MSSMGNLFGTQWDAIAGIDGLGIALRECSLTCDLLLDFVPQNTRAAKCCSGGGVGSPC